MLRIMGANAPGDLRVLHALTKIRGINLSLSHAILKKARMNPGVRTGFLTEAEIEKLEEIINAPEKYDIPEWLFNRRKDSKTGKDLHLIGADLVLRTKNDIDGEKAMHSWRGYRHSYGLKVRGQRTKTTGRAGKSLGVKKKTLQRSGGR